MVPPLIPVLRKEKRVSEVSLVYTASFWPDGLHVETLSEKMLHIWLAPLPPDVNAEDLLIKMFEERNSDKILTRKLFEPK